MDQQRETAAIDHLAHASFDVAATHRFYTEVLGARLATAFDGDSPEWNARYLLAEYDLHGARLDFFTYTGIGRPAPDGLPRDIRHVGITVPPAMLAELRGRLESHAVEYWVEHHDGPDDVHLYVPDPNGLVLELSAARPPTRGRADAADVVRRWSAGQARDRG